MLPEMFLQVIEVSTMSESHSDGRNRGLTPSLARYRQNPVGPRAFNLHASTN